MKIKLFFLSGFLFLICCKTQRNNLSVLKENIKVESKKKNNYKIKTILRPDHTCADLDVEQLQVIKEAGKK